MAANESGHWSWFQLIEPVSEDVFNHHAVGYEPLLHSILAALLLSGAAFITKKALENGGSGTEALIPSSRFSVRNFFEIFTEALSDLVKPSLGSKTATYFPLLATLFIYILVMNLQGIVPGFQPPTANVNTNAAMALAVFVIYNVQGVRTQGLIPYLKHFMGPVIFIAPLMVAVEIFSHLARPLTLTLRLYGNMFGDHTVLNTFLFGLPQELGMPFLAVALPAIFVGLGVFVSFIQALVFTLLSTMYIALAVEDHHH